jgi:aryl-alcohol dehydrogenase-like predicted oxidoreductase
VEVRTIGGIEVSALGLGTARMASLGSGRSRADAARLLDAAADLGISFLDTADTYGSTACERWLGELMASRSHRFTIATKSGLATADLPGPLRALNQPVKKVMQRAGRVHQLAPDHLRRSIDASLRRLRRERIEFYFLHSPPAGIEAHDDVFSVLEEARVAGKIGVYGVSSSEPTVIKAAFEVRGCAVAQTIVNPLSTDAITELLTTKDSVRSVELVGNHVLLEQLLGPEAPSNGLSPHWAELARKLDSRSAERGLTKAQLLLRHAAAVAPVRVVLTGTSSPAHLAENVAALAAPPRAEDLLV